MTTTVATTAKSKTTIAVLIHNSNKIMNAMSGTATTSFSTQHQLYTNIPMVFVGAMSSDERKHQQQRRQQRQRLFQLIMLLVVMFCFIHTPVVATALSGSTSIAQSFVRRTETRSVLKGEKPQQQRRIQRRLQQMQQRKVQKEDKEKKEGGEDVAVDGTDTSTSNDDGDDAFVPPVSDGDDGTNDDVVDDTDSSKNNDDDSGGTTTQTDDGTATDGDDNLNAGPSTDDNLPVDGGSDDTAVTNDNGSDPSPTTTTNESASSYMEICQMIVNSTSISYDDVIFSDTSSSSTNEQTPAGGKTPPTTTITYTSLEIKYGYEYYTSSNAVMPDGISKAVRTYIIDTYMKSKCEEQLVSRLLQSTSTTSTTTLNPEYDLYVSSILRGITVGSTKMINGVQCNSKQSTSLSGTSSSSSSAVDGSSSATSADVANECYRMESSHYIYIDTSASNSDMKLNETEFILFLLHSIQDSFLDGTILGYYNDEREEEAQQQNPQQQLPPVTNVLFVYAKSGNVEIQQDDNDTSNSTSVDTNANSNEMNGIKKFFLVVFVLCIVFIGCMLLLKRYKPMMYQKVRSTLSIQKHISALRLYLQSVLTSMKDYRRRNKSINLDDDDDDPNINDKAVHFNDKTDKDRVGSKTKNGVDNNNINNNKCNSTINYDDSFFDETTIVVSPSKTTHTTTTEATTGSPNDDSCMDINNNNHHHHTTTINSNENENEFECGFECEFGSDMILEDLQNSNQNSTMTSNNTATACGNGRSICRTKDNNGAMEQTSSCYNISAGKQNSNVNNNNVSTSSSFFHAEWDKQSSFFSKDPFFVDNNDDNDIQKYNEQSNTNTTTSNSKTNVRMNNASTNNDSSAYTSPRGERSNISHTSSNDGGTPSTKNNAMIESPSTTTSSHPCRKEFDYGENDSYNSNNIIVKSTHVIHEGDEIQLEHVPPLRTGKKNEVEERNNSTNNQSTEMYHDNLYGIPQQEQEQYQQTTLSRLTNIWKSIVNIPKEQPFRRGRNTATVNKAKNIPSPFEEIISAGATLNQNASNVTGTSNGKKPGSNYFTPDTLPIEEEVTLHGISTIDRGQPILGTSGGGGGDGGDACTTSSLGTTDFGTILDDVQVIVDDCSSKYVPSPSFYERSVSNKHNTTVDSDSVYFVNNATTTSSKGRQYHHLSYLPEMSKRKSTSPDTVEL